MDQNAAVFTRRIYYLDALRCFCMLFGIFVHSASIDYYHEIAPLVYIREASELFRMAAFYVISGFFTAFVYVRAPDIMQFARKRGSLLLVPLFSTLILLNPATNWLMYKYFRGPISLQEYFLDGGWQMPGGGMGNWHLHLWFLIALTFYAFVTPPLMRLLRQKPIARWLQHYAAITGRFTLWTNVIIVAVTAVFTQYVYVLISPIVGGTLFSWVVRASLYYFPFFLLGILSFANRDFFEKMHETNWFGILFFGAIYAYTTYLRAEGTGTNYPLSVIYWIGKAGLTTFVIAALLALFRKIADKPSPTLTFLIDATYSYYLFQMLVIYLIANALTPYTDNPYTIFAACVVIGSVILFALHGFVLRRVPALYYLFNGKPLRPLFGNKAGAK